MLSDIQNDSVSAVFVKLEPPIGPLLLEIPTESVTRKGRELELERGFQCDHWLHVTEAVELLRRVDSLRRVPACGDR